MQEMKGLSDLSQPRVHVNSSSSTQTWGSYAESMTDQQSLDSGHSACTQASVNRTRGGHKQTGRQTARWMDTNQQALQNAACRGTPQAAGARAPPHQSSPFTHNSAGALTLEQEHCRRECRFHVASQTEVKTVLSSFAVTRGSCPCRSAGSGSWCLSYHLPLCLQTKLNGQKQMASKTKTFSLSFLVWKTNPQK